MTNAEQLITDAGLKPTKARVAVLNSFHLANNAMSHPEILEQLASHNGFDRVTIYRVLDWLTEHNLIHKISGENRAWKFQLSKQAGAHQHAHLQCTVCGKITCIHELEPHFPKPLLEKYRVESIDINIKGQCPDCA